MNVSCQKTANKNENTSVPVSENTTEKQKVKMILDLDTGIDDAMALAYALGSPEIDLLAVVATYGNVSTETSVQNTLNLLEMLHRTDIPVYAGVTHSLSTTEVYKAVQVSRTIHGENGIGNISIPQAQRKVEQGDGVDYLIESAKKYGKDLVIVATGPMTNLAKAIEKEPKLKDMVGKIVIMGGALTVPGNINQLAEANIYQDPVAANNVFTDGTKLTMVGLDVTSRTIFTKKETQKWRDLGTKSAIAYADMVDYYIGSYLATQPEIGGCALHDPLAVAVAIHPELVQTFAMYMNVGITKEDWGRTIGDKGKLREKDPNVTACINVDYDKFCNDFYNVLANLFKAN